MARLPLPRFARLTMVAGAALAVGCDPPPKVPNDVYDCTIEARPTDARAIDAGPYTLSERVPYRARCKAFRTQVVLDVVKVSVLTHKGTPDDSPMPGTADYEQGSDIPSGGRVVIPAGSTWDHEGQVLLTDEAFGPRSSLSCIDQRLRLSATPSFPDDLTIKDENSKRSPNYWKWVVREDLIIKRYP